MRTGWVRRIGPYDVEEITGCRRTGAAVDTSRPPVGVLHTTEGSWDSAIGVYRSRLALPTFQIDRRRIGMCHPLGEMPATLRNPPGGVETNRWTRVQVEIVGFSQQTPWLPHEDTLDVLVHLVAYLADAADIPLETPYGDDLGPLPWATPTYQRRRDGKWGKTAGWFGHVDVPENDHWDPGRMRRSVVLRRAAELAGGKPRTLVLKTPFMRGADCAEAKRLLRENRFGNFGPRNTDPHWGMEAAQAAANAKFWLGYPRRHLVGTFGPGLRAFLDGSSALPAAYQTRRAARLAAQGFRLPAQVTSRDPHPHHGGE